MKKIFCLLLLLTCSLSFGQIQNWKGYLDTTLLWLNNTTTRKYSKVYNLTECVASSVTMLVNDTNAAGFKNDATRLCYGFQVGTPVINSGGGLDTAWGVLDTLDTISTAGYGTLPAGGRYSLSTDMITETWGMSDTSLVTGYSAQIRPLRAYNWSVFLRLWCIGMTGITTATANKVIIVVHRMTALPTTSR